MVDSTPLIPDGKEEKKQGHRVLCCCDSRKAVLIINAIALVVVLAGFIDASMKTPPGAGPIIFFVLNVVIYIFVMISAFTFGIKGVEIGIFMVVVDIIWFSISIANTALEARGWINQGSEDAIGMIVYVTIMYLLFLLTMYANSVYVLEVSRGIMSKETHSRVKYSW